MLARKAAAMEHAPGTDDPLPVGDDTLEAFAEKLSRFRTTLEGTERLWLDTILLAAGSDPEHDVLGHSPTLPRRLAARVAGRLGVDAPGAPAGKKPARKRPRRQEKTPPDHG
jgi:hypothetical protein